MNRTLAVAAVALSLAAFGAASSPAFAQDGAQADRQQQRAEKLKKRFDRIDKNGDGAVDKAEVEGPLQRSFKRIDKNNDGVIEESDVEAFKERTSKRNPNRGERLARRLQKADANRDGKVTMSEFMTLTPRWFERGDSNRDGRVTRAELDAFLDRPRGRRRE